MNKNSPGNKILIIGSNASGKTTFGNKLHKKINIPYYELDYYSWLPDWKERPNEDFRKIVDEITKKPEWIVDGNYKSIQDITVNRADTIIWLDYSYLKIMYRVIKRSLTRSITREPMWHDNKESFGRAFSKDSIILFALKTYKRKEIRYTAFISSEEYKNKNWIRLKNKRDEEKFWSSINSSYDI